MSWQTEFPDFPPAAMPAMLDGFTDRSWRNDICPCFIHEATGLVLWINWPDASQREGLEGRFILQRCVEFDPEAGWQLGVEGEETSLAETDDWQKLADSIPSFLVDYLDELDDGATREQAARTIRMRCNLLMPGDAKAILDENRAAAKPCPDLEAAMQEIIRDPHAICKKWVRKLGTGFHPDTRGRDYRPRMSAEDIVEYDGDMETLFEVASDPYECALMAMQDAGLC